MMTEENQNATVSSRAKWTPWIAALSAAVAALVVFLPVLSNGFVDNWDDDFHLLNNLYYRGLGAEQLRWMWTSIHMGHYHPLYWMLHGFNFTISGMDPFGYHYTSWLLHAANAFLFVFLAARLILAAQPKSAAEGPTGLWVAAAFAAGLFALHPLRVEPIAWASSQRDPSSTFFLLLSILAYLRSVDRHRAGQPRTMLLVAWIAAYICSLLSKPMGMTFPFVLFILDIYPLRRLGGWKRADWFGPGKWAVWGEKAVCLVFAVACVVTAFVSETKIGALGSAEEHPLFGRMAVASSAPAFYLWQTFVPLWISPLYQKPMQPSDIMSSLAILATAGIVVTVALVLLWRRAPGLLAAWMAYLFMLGPVSGLVQIGPFIYGNRFSYLPCMGWAICGGGLLLLLLRRWRNKPGRRKSIVIVCVVLLVGLGALTWRQLLYWRGPEVFWRRVIELKPDSASLAYNGLGSWLARDDRLDEAFPLFDRALEITPDFLHALNNKGAASAHAERYDDAEEIYRRLSQLQPEKPGHWTSLADVVEKQNRPMDAAGYWQKALPLTEDADSLADTYVRLANALALAQNRKEMVAVCRQGAARLADHPAGLLKIGAFLAKHGEMAEAETIFRSVARIDPEDPHAHFRLGLELAKQEEYAEALSCFERAAKLDPNSVDVAKALAQCREALAYAAADDAMRKDAE